MNRILLFTLGRIGGPLKGIKSHQCLYDKILRQMAPLAIMGEYPITAVLTAETKRYTAVFC